MSVNLVLAMWLRSSSVLFSNSLKTLLFLHTKPQANPGGKGKHGVEGRGDRESSQQSVPWCPASSALNLGRTWQCRERVHDPFDYLLYVGVPLTAEFGTYHSTSATFPCPGNWPAGKVIVAFLQKLRAFSAAWNESGNSFIWHLNKTSADLMMVYCKIS